MKIYSYAFLMVKNDGSTSISRAAAACITCAINEFEALGKATRNVMDDNPDFAVHAYKSIITTIGEGDDTQTEDS